MNQDSDARDEMKPEYDFRGGVRGKYYERYHAERNRVVVVIEDSPFIAWSTAGSAQSGGISYTLQSPALRPSPTVQIGSLEEASRQ
jgi:hypothetical protein